MSVSILVVDDEQDVAELFRQRFRRETRQGLYVLHFAFSAEEALARLAEEIEPQLIVILSDINMPGMDGLALLREIKKLYSDLPVMMVTAYGDEERRRRQPDENPVQSAKAANTCRMAVFWSPSAESGTSTGVLMPAARHLSTPSRIFAGGPNKAMSASQ